MIVPDSCKKGVGESRPYKPGTDTFKSTIHPNIRSEQSGATYDKPVGRAARNESLVHVPEVESDIAFLHFTFVIFLRPKLFYMLVPGE